MINNGQIDLA